METTRPKIDTFAKVCLRVALIAMLFISCSAYSASALTITAKWNSSKGTVVRDPAGTLNNDSGTTVSANTNLTFKNSPKSGYYIKEIIIKDNSNNPNSGNDITYKWGSTNNDTSWLTFNADLSVVTINTGTSNFEFEVKFDSPSNKEVRVKWGTTTSWSGDGGSVTATSKTVTNGAKVSPDFKSNVYATLTLVPNTGYVVESVEIISGTNLSSTGTWTNITPTSGNTVSFPMSDRDWCVRVKFAVTATAAVRSFIAYYGTDAIDATAATAPNWNGGRVFRAGGTTDELGTASYLVDTYSSNSDKRVLIFPGASAPAYRVAAIKYAEASWSNPRSVTVDAATIVTVTPDTLPSVTHATYGTGYELTFYASSPKSYIIFVQFVPAAATGGKVGVWYGTNNTTDIDSPANADGNGGTVYQTSGGTVQLPNRVADSGSRATNGNITLEARPAAGFKIVKINYKESGAASWTPVTLGSDPTVTHSFNVPVSGGKSYVVWVVYASTAASSFDVTGTVSTDAITVSCGTSTITPSSQVVNINQKATFTLSTSVNCDVDTIDFNGTGPSTLGISGTTYTTPAITSISSFVVKFKPVGFKINAYVDGSSPTGSGSITPATSGSTLVDVVKGTSQMFIISPNTGYSISHVYVTDTNRGYTNFDVAPLSNNTYTFNNIQADGVIRVTFVASVPAAGNDYCQIPPFVQGQTNLSPNVLIIFDNSGSMSSLAYKGNAGKNYDCTSSHNSTTNLCNTIYYGYFDPYTMYKTDTSNSNVYLKDTVTLNLSSTNGKSGNYLNYVNMSRVDIIRKVLVGGRVTGKGTSALAGRGTTSVKYLYTDNGQWVEYGTAEPVGIVQNLEGRVRFGLQVLGNNAGSSTEGGQIIAKLGASKATLVTAIEGPSTNPTTYTPLAEALYEATRYYQAKPSAYNTNTDYGDSTWNPPADPIIQYACQKHFILLLTDGEPNSNNNLPGLSTKPTLNGYTDNVFNVVNWENMIPENDKASNTNSTCSSFVYNTGISGNTNTEKTEAVAFYAHNTDLRSTTYGNDLTGNQNITIYPVYAFGDGKGTKTLHMVAKYGGYESKNGNNAGTDPNKYASPDQAAEWDKDGNCVPDTYFEGDDGAALEAGIITVMANILAKVASGTAASILSNSEGSGANLLQAVFYPNKIFENATEASWIGEMQNMWYYLDPFIANSTVREDTDTDRTLNLKSDYAARFFFNGAETLVETKRDTDGDGVGDIIVNATVKPDDVKSIWRAGKLLRTRSAATRTIHTSVDGISLLLPSAESPPKGGFYAPSATSTRVTALQPYLQAANNDSNAEAVKIINYIRGTDQTNYRSRAVSLLKTGDPPTEWKLGDIISSTPRLQSSSKLNFYNLPAPSGYADASYAAFINTANYKNRGMVYVGANDGMLHAFKLGKLTVSGASIYGDTKAKLEGVETIAGTELGAEQWAYIPRNALPYLKYFTDRDNYKHLYYVDGPTVLADISTKIPSGCSGDYSQCSKDTVYGSNWGTVLIGSMGLGGASRLKATTACADGATGTCVKTPIYEPVLSGTGYTYDTTKGIGYSSYFALDITNQYFNSDGTLANQPTLKWELAHPELGYATSGAAIVRISATVTDPLSGLSVPDPTKNGKWYAVFASGPTGPIDTSMHQFKGKSDQNLKLFIVDLGATGALTLNTNFWIKDTGIQRAFGGSMLPAPVDSDRWDSTAPGNYQHEALYLGYTKANILDTAAITAATEWTDGGVLRVLTKEDPNPANWVVSPLITGIGPVTSGVTRLQDRVNKKLWLYFGTGRFYYSGDDSDSQRYLMGVQEGCYNSATDKINKIDPNCNTTTGAGAPLTLSSLKSQDIIGTLSSTDKGWYISLDGRADPLGAERVITDASAQANGTVCYATFQPTADVCKFGGNTYIWCVKYNTGGCVCPSGLNGKILLQVSTGSFEEMDLDKAFNYPTCSGCPSPNPSANPPPGVGEPGYIPPPLKDGRKTGGNISGLPPGGSGGGGGGSGSDFLKSNAGLTPMKKILHIQEK